MRPTLAPLALAALLVAAPVRGQVGGAGVSTSASGSTSIGVPGLPLNRSYYSTQNNTSIYGAPGNYGMAYGTASYGMPRTYSVYSTSYGPGYGYGYAPYAFLPGHYGVGLWRPGHAAPGYVYGAGFYRTFPVPYRPVTGPPIPPPVGAYAPGFGPAPLYGW